MSLRTTLRDRLLDTWVGDPWHAKSSRATLEDVTFEEAAARPLAGTQNIWETVLHIVAWTEEATSRVRGKGHPEPERGDWPAMPTPSDAAWKETTAQLSAARKELLHALEEAHEEDLYMQVSGGSGASKTRAQTIQGLLEHDIYHLGQIALLKKAIRTK
jgi:uncharacterized damage-inducible protein DinB